MGFMSKVSSNSKMTPEKRAQLIKAVQGSAGILSDAQAEKMIEEISRHRGRPFTAPKGTPDRGKKK